MVFTGMSHCEEPSAIAHRRRSGHITKIMQELPPDFHALASAMPPMTRRLLLDGALPATVPLDVLLDELGIDGENAVRQCARVVSAPNTLSEVACNALRALVESECRSDVDTVDGCPDPQVNISRERLATVIGAEAAEAICADLPAAFCESAQQINLIACRHVG